MNKEYLIYKLSDEVKNSCKIDKDAFKKFNVKRGLRNEDGSGVLVGLTNIGNVVGYERDAEGKLTPTEGKLYYRGYELDDLVTPLLKEKRFGFEEVAFLLLSGQLPDKEELDAFKELLNDNMPLDHRTITHIIELEGSNVFGGANLIYCHRRQPVSLPYRAPEELTQGWSGKNLQNSYTNYATREYREWEKNDGAL